MSYKLRAASLICALLTMIVAIPSGRADDKNKEKRLTEESRLAIVRFVNGEFVQAVKLPASKNGFRIKVGEPLAEIEQRLNRALVRDGAVANIGEEVQITNVKFGDKEIEVDINYGSKKKKSWRDRINIQVGVGGVPMPTTKTTTTTKQDGQKQPERGATIILDFGKPLPDITPDELKALLSMLVNFNKRSAAKQWLETLPPEVSKAIGEGRVILGMGEEEVIAALGKKGDHISREDVRDQQDNVIREVTWRYGEPPSVIFFIIFVDNKVVRIKTCRLACVDGMPATKSQ